MAGVAPDADALADVDDVGEALALQDRGGEAAALAAAADRRDRPVARDLVEAPREVAVGDVEGAGDVLGRVLGGVADVEDQRRLRALGPRRQLVGVDQLDPRHRPLLDPPGGHPALEEAAHPHADGRQQLGRGALVAAGGGDDDDLGPLRHDPRHLGGEAGVVGGGAEGTGDVGFVELVVGAPVDHEGAACHPLLELVWGHRRRRAEVVEEGAAVDRDDRRHVRWFVAEAADRVLDELRLVGGPERPVVAPLEPDRRGVLEVEAGAAAERAAEVAGPELDLVVEGQQPLVQGAEDVRGPLARLDREVGPGDVADEQRVAAEQGPGGAVAAGVAEQEGGVLGPVAGGVDRLDREVADLQRPAVGERLVRVLGLGQLVDVDARPGRPRQAPVAGDVVGVVVGLQDVPDPDPVQPRQPPVGVDVPLRVDDDGDARFAVGDQIGSAAEVLVDDLPEEHGLKSTPRVPPGERGTPQRRPRIVSGLETLSRSHTFWALGATIALYLAASAAPTPLYVVYQDEWGFSATTLTLVFAIYVFGLLGALLVFGRLSDYIGRRPVIAVAIALEIVAMVLFVVADGVPTLSAARLVQGIATGMAMTAMGAALVDLNPPEHPALAGIVSGLAPISGLAVGALLAGTLVEYGPWSTSLVYLLILVGLLAAALVAWRMPETGPRRPGALASLRPRLGVPPRLRPEILALVPILIASWGLGGLYLSLGPSVAAEIFDLPNHVVGGLVVTLLCGTGAVTIYRLRAWELPRALMLSAGLLAAGLTVTLVGLIAETVILAALGTLIAGIGFGASARGTFGTIASIALPEERGGLFAVFYVISYLAFSLPALAAGLASTEVGLRPTAIVYAAAALVLSLLAAWAQRRLATHSTLRRSASTL